jgi:hypothetical protein
MQRSLAKVEAVVSVTTVMICGKEIYLFQEDDKWFVEAKEYQ